MSATIYSNIIPNLANEMDSLTKSFIFNGYNALADALVKPLGTLCVLLIILIGYGITRGLIKAPLQELSKFSIRMGIVYMLVFNWGLFSEYFVGLFIHGSEELGAVLMKATNINVSIPAGSGINGGLQAVLTEVIRVGKWTWDKATMRHFAPVFASIMIYASGLIAIGLAFFEIIVAKLMISICLCTAPLFLIFTLHEKTRSFFDRWLGILLGFSLVLVFVSSVIGLSLYLIHWSIEGHYTNHAANMSTVDWIPLMIVSALSVMAVLEVTGLAKSIGGSCSTGGGSAMAGGFMGAAMGTMAVGMSPLVLGGKKLGKKLGDKASGLYEGYLPGGITGMVKSASGNMFNKGGDMMKGIQNRMRGQK